MTSWKSVFRTSVRKWHQKKYSCDWGFNENMNYTELEHGDLVQPWATEGRHLMAYVYGRAKNVEPHETSLVPCGATSNSKKKGELLFVVEKPHRNRKDKPIWYSVNLPPGYMLESPVTSTLQGQRYYTGANVIGARGDCMVIQISKKTRNIDLLVVQKKGQELDTIALFSWGPFSVLYFMEAVVSPSCTHIILQPSAFYCARFGHRPKPASIELLRIESNGSCTSLGPLLHASSSSNTQCTDPTSPYRRAHVFAFDPRHNWKRIVVGYQYASVIRAYDLQQRKIVAENNSHGSLRQQTENLVYSPDGCFIASLVASIDIQRTRIYVHSILVYCSNSLDVLKSLDYHGPALQVSLFPACMFPIFSTSGRFLAIPTHSENTYSDITSCDVEVLPVPPQLHLQSLCRTVILIHTKPYHIDWLPLPTSLKNYLHFKPFLE